MSAPTAQTVAAKACREDIQAMLAVLMAGSPVIEIRALDTPKRTQSGYFDDLGKAVTAAVALSGQGPAVYAVLNEVAPRLKARAHNRLEGWAKHTTADDDILKRLWLPIDVDPQRPAGVSSTDEEHAAAIARIEGVREFLREQGFPEGILADSGNGGHLLYAIDLPNTQESLQLIEGCLAALDFYFSDDAIHVDRTTGNAARIWKVYGTLACKGDSLPEWPHRLARILDMPATIDVVPLDLLEKLAAMAPAQAQAHTNGNGHGSFVAGEFDIDAWISGHGLQVGKSGPWNGGRKWVLDVCPWTPSHTDRSAYILQMASGALSAGCHHNGCQGKGWKDLRALFEEPRAYSSEYGHNGTSSEDIPPVSVPTPDKQGATKAATDWPAPPSEDAYAGLAGRFVELAGEHSEADPVALLTTFLTLFGCAVGTKPHMMVGATRHAPRLFIAHVGPTSKGRKGEGFSPNRVVFSLADAEWARHGIQGGASSGEGIISAVRDKVERLEAVKGSPSQYETVTVDDGVEDKRLLILEPELARVLQTKERQGNTLSAILRDAWDRGDLSVLTKQVLRATNAHICLIGHITTQELRNELTQTDTANGFGNRFAWFAVRRARYLSRPRPFEGLAVDALVTELQSTLTWAKQVEHIDFAEDAGEIWDAVYSNLSAEREGLVWSILGRAEAQVLRLAMIYALVDRSSVVQSEHLISALDLWTYSERSAKYIFGDATGNPTADTILRALRQTGQSGLSRTLISDLFGRNIAANKLSLALIQLQVSGLASMATIRPKDGKGRDIEMWYATAPS